MINTIALLTQKKVTHNCKPTFSHLCVYAIISQRDLYPFVRVVVHQRNENIWILQVFLNTGSQLTLKSED